MTRILIWGIGGRMGKAVYECASSLDDIQIVGGVDKFSNPNDFTVPVFTSGMAINIDVDVIIDFSRPEALGEILSFALAHNTKIVLATTGYSDEQEEQIKQASKSISVFQSANMSLGINLLIELCRKASSFLGEAYDIEIIEQHHNVKVDAPSGTALSIAKEINNVYDDEKDFVFGRHNKNQRRQPKEIGIHAVRGGTIIGKHDVLFIGKDEIIKIGHEAQSKSILAAGSLRASKYLMTTDNGLFNMKDMLAKAVE